MCETDWRRRAAEGASEWRIEGASDWRRGGCARTAEEGTGMAEADEVARVRRRGSAMVLTERGEAASTRGARRGSIATLTRGQHG